MAKSTKLRWKQYCNCNNVKTWNSRHFAVCGYLHLIQQNACTKWSACSTSSSTSAYRAIIMLCAHATLATFVFFLFRFYVFLFIVNVVEMFDCPANIDLTCAKTKTQTTKHRNNKQLMTQTFAYALSNQNIGNFSHRYIIQNIHDVIKLIGNCWRWYWLD